MDQPPRKPEDRSVGTQPAGRPEAISEAVNAPPPPVKVLGFWRVPFFYGWVIVGAVFVAEFAAGGVGSLVLPLFFKAMSSEMGWSLTLLTGITTAQTLANAAVGPGLGPMLDRFGARPVMVFGAIVAGLGFLALTRVQAIWQFWVLYAAVGALGLHEMGGFTGPVLITKWFVRSRGKAMAAATLATTLGGAIMAPVLGYLISNIGWRNTLGVMGIGLMVIVIPIALIFIRRQPEDMGLLPDGDAAPLASRKGAPRAARAEVSWTVKEALRSRTFWVLVISVNLVTLAGNTVIFHLVPFLTLQQGLSAEAAGLVLTMRLASSTLSRPLWGWATDRFPMRNCLAVGFLARSLGALVLLFLPFPINIGALIITNLPGAGQGMLQNLAFANYYGRRYSGSIQGMAKPFTTISSLLGPLIISVMFDLTGTFTTIFVIASCLGIIGSVVVLWATPPVKKAEAAEPVVV